MSRELTPEEMLARLRVQRPIRREMADLLDKLADCHERIAEVTSDPAGERENAAFFRERAQQHRHTVAELDAYERQQAEMN